MPLPLEILYRGEKSNTTTSERKSLGGVFISPAKLHSDQAELTQKVFESLFVPTGVSLPPLNNKGGVFSNPMSQGFIDSQRGLDVNQLDEETMFIELGQFPNPVGEFHILLFQIQRILVRLSLMELLIKARFNEEGFTVWSLIIMRNHSGNDLQTDGSHSFLLFLQRGRTNE